LRAVIWHRLDVLCWSRWVAQWWSMLADAARRSRMAVL